MANVARKVGLLTHGGPAQKPGRMEVDQASTVEDTGRSRKDKELGALKLWREWATDALGPMSAEPTFEERQRKSNKVKALERKCAELAAKTQRRLEVSAALRGAGGPAGAGGGALTSGASGGAAAWAANGGGTAAGRPLSATTGSTRSAGAVFNKEALWAAREQRRHSAYEAVRAAGQAEREMGITGSTGTSSRPTSAAIKLKSRGLLDAIISTHGQGGGQDGGAGQRGLNRGGSVGRNRPMSAMPVMMAGAGHTTHTLGTLTRAGSFTGSPGAGIPPRPRPASASLIPYAGATSHGGPGVMQANASMNPADVAALEAEIERLREQLDETRHAVESQGELESQLRGTIDLLRARVAAQGAREIESQRRLTQHARLEPLFDRLAESFVFKSPEEVVERLEFLEDDRLGSFDQLLRTQEEVASLQKQLDAALARVEHVRQQLTTENITATGRLQERNNELRAELEELEALNRRLVDRQEALVTLQTAVLDLWGRCQRDPSFREANGIPSDGPSKPNSRPGSPSKKPSRAGAPSRPASASKGQEAGDEQEGGGGDGASSSSGGQAGRRRAAVSAADTGDPVAILSMVQEYLIAKSPELSSRHYLDMQKVANRVWLHHFQHKSSLRGKVVETFEALSNLADIMAAKIRTIQDQVERAKGTERSLSDNITRLETQKRALAAALARRDTLVRDLAGVPRKERPNSAAAYHAVAQQDEVPWDREGFGRSSGAGLLKAGRGGAGASRPGSAAISRSNSITRGAGGMGSSGSGLAAAAAAAAATGGYGSGYGSPAGSDPMRASRARPSSAPVRRSMVAAPGGGYSGAEGVAGEEGDAGGTPVHPAAALPPSLQPGPGGRPGPVMQRLLGLSPQGPRIADLPEGPHWEHLSQQADAIAKSGGRSRPGSARAGGALFGAASAAAASAAVAPVGSPGAPGATAAASAAPGPYQTGAVDGAAYVGAQYAEAAQYQQPYAAPGGTPGKQQAFEAAAGGALAPEGSAAAAASSGWSAPTRRAIESSFLGRLGRAAGPTGAAL